MTVAEMLAQEGHTWDAHMCLHRLAWVWKDTLKEQQRWTGAEAFGHLEMAGVCCPVLVEHNRTRLTWYFQANIQIRDDSIYRMLQRSCASKGNFAKRIRIQTRR